jgi:hypothetical protein
MGKSARAAEIKFDRARRCCQIKFNKKLCMNLSNPFFFLSYIGQAISALVCLVGLILALMRWSQHPRASLWAAIGFGLLLISRIAGVAFSILLPFFAQNLGGGSAVASLNLGFNFILGLVGAAGIGALVVALYGRQPGGTRS